MRILNWEEFSKLPDGTLFCFISSEHSNGPYLKGATFFETRETEDDEEFEYPKGCKVNTFAVWTDPDEFKLHKEINFEFTEYSTEDYSEYPEDLLYGVYSKEEKKKIIDSIKLIDLQVMKE
jgi:hypothetical protein